MARRGVETGDETPEEEGQLRVQRVTEKSREEVTAEGYGEAMRSVAGRAMVWDILAVRLGLYASLALQDNEAGRWMAIGQHQVALDLRLELRERFPAEWRKMVEENER